MLIKTVLNILFNYKTSFLSYDEIIKYSEVVLARVNSSFITSIIDFTSHYNLAWGYWRINEFIKNQQSYFFISTFTDSFI